MNSYKLNGRAGHYFRQAVCKGLGIEHTEIYKKVKDISSDGTIITKEGKRYKLKLEEIKDKVAKVYFSDITPHIKVIVYTDKIVYKSSNQKEIYFYDKDKNLKSIEKLGVYASGNQKPTDKTKKRFLDYETHVNYLKLNSIRTETLYL